VVEKDPVEEEDPVVEDGQVEDGEGTARAATGNSNLSKFILKESLTTAKLS
jgi:hypothetical protein